MIDIALLATGAWTAIQPYLPVFATKAAEEIQKKVPEAVDKVWQAITNKFEANLRHRKHWRMCSRLQKMRTRRPPSASS